MLGNLNGLVGYRVEVGTTGAFGVPGENDNERRVTDFCTERGLCLDNKYFEHKGLHKYTRVPRGLDGVEV